MVITGWVVHAVPPVPPPGWVVKASFEAAPAETAIAEEVRESEPLVAVRV